MSDNTPYNPGGDMSEGTASAHIETADEIAANPIDENGQSSVSAGPAPVGPSYEKQHAKVLRFEISVGKDDDEHTVEQFEAAVREALTFARDHGPSVFNSHSGELRWNNLTTSGSYYIIDGKVCLPKDYDPATKNRKPGTFPPSWAGGPSNPKETEELLAEQRLLRQVGENATDEDRVKALAGNMVKDVQEKS